MLPVSATDQLMMVRVTYCREGPENVFWRSRNYAFGVNTALSLFRNEQHLSGLAYRPNLRNRLSLLPTSHQTPSIWVSSLPPFPLVPSPPSEFNGSRPQTSGSRATWTVRNTVGKMIASCRSPSSKVITIRCPQLALWRRACSTHDASSKGEGKENNEREREGLWMLPWEGNDNDEDEEPPAIASLVHSS